MKDIEKLTEENRKLQLAVNELSVLNEIATTITTTQTVNDIVEQIVMKCIRHLGAEEGTISLLQQEEGKKFQTMIRKQDLTEDRVPIRLDDQVTGWMLLKKQPLMSNDIKNDDRFKLADDDYKGFHSILSVPLKAKGELIGYLAVFNKKGGEEFHDEDRRLLSIIASQSAQIIENARLYEEEKEYMKMKEEMLMARRIQNNLLPDHSPDIPGYEIAAANIPAKEVGGDYFDFIELEDHRLGFCVGDITGKGMPAALLMANLQASLRSQTLINGESSDCLTNINKLLYKSTEANKFATLFYGVLNSDTHQIKYCNAGHDHPLLLRAKKVEKQLEATGLLLGVMEDVPYHSAVIQLEPNDVLVLYTDGITEAMNASEEEFGIERSTNVIVNSRDKSAEQIKNALLDEVSTYVKDHPQSDDITLMVIKRVS